MLKANNEVNGFKLREINIAGDTKCFKIEYLINGEYFDELKEPIIVTGLEQERALREKLLMQLQEKLHIKTEVDETLRIENQKPLIGAINGFKIITENTADGRENVTIELLKSGYLCATKSIGDVPESVLEKIKEMLISNTRYNLAQSQECRVIHLFDFLALI